jgi:hypothetical protein
MMRRLIAVLVTTGLLTASTQSLLARPTQIRSTWDELSRMIPGVNIRMILPDTTLIRGQALDVRPDELVVDVRRTSNPRLHPKGRTGIPRSDVSTIELFLQHSSRTNPDAGGIGAALGVVALSPLLFYLGETNKASGWAALAIAVGGAAGGAIIANRLHPGSNDVLIIVVP